MSQTHAVIPPPAADGVRCATPVAAAGREMKYAPPPPLHQRKVFRRGLYAFVALVIVFWAWRWGPVTWRRAQAVYWQHQCLNYAPPRDFAVFDDHPAAARALSGDRRYTASHTAFGAGGGYAVHDAPVWQMLSRVETQSQFRAAPVVFMHRRRSPAGNERLVSVQIGYVLGAGADRWNSLTFHGSARGLGSLVRANNGVGTSARSAISNLTMFRRPGEGTRLLAGQPDPKDESHFTIDYVYQEQGGTIDGWLNDDDSVTLAPRAGRVARETPGAVWWSPGGAPMAAWVDQAGGTYDVAAEPIRPHTRFQSRPIELGPRPGAMPHGAPVPAATQQGSAAPGATAPPTTAQSP